MGPLMKTQDQSHGDPKRKTVYPFGSGKACQQENFESVKDKHIISHTHIIQECSHVNRTVINLTVAVTCLCFL